MLSISHTALIIPSKITSSFKFNEELKYMAEEYDNNNSLHHLRKDTHEAHTESRLAKMLSTIALIASILSLALAVWALDKAGQAQSDANRATESVQNARP